MKTTKKILAASAFIALLAPLTSQAAIRVLDFDYDAAGNAIGNGDVIDNQYSAWGVTVGGCNIDGDIASGTDQVNGVCNSPDLANQQSAFNTLETNTEDPDLEFHERNNGVFVSREHKSSPGVANRNYVTLDEYQDYYSDFATDTNDVEADAWKSPGNVLIIQETGQSQPDDEGSRPAGFYTFEFTSPVEILSLDFFDTEDTPAGDPARVIYFHTLSGIVERTVPVLANATYIREFYTSLFDVTKIVINLPGSGAINNLVFNDDPTSTNEVSAPASIAILLAGAFGIAYRRRKS